MLTIRRLDIADAQILMTGARQKAKEIGVPMCIAICDESGQLIAFERMDGGKSNQHDNCDRQGFHRGSSQARNP